MDCKKVGSLILKLRKEKGMTQKNIADRLNISDKTVSKWERGLGCPDVTLLHELSKVLGVNIGKILIGDLEPNDTDGGNMKKIKFYVCPDCGNVMTSTGDADITCCGRLLEKLEPKKMDEAHEINIEEVENDYYITFNHEMKKDHYISFIAYVTYNSILLVKLYPEQGAEVRLPRFNRGKFYVYCSRDGLYLK